MAQPGSIGPLYVPESPPPDYNQRFNILRPLIPTIQYGSYALLGVILAIFFVGWLTQPEMRLMSAVSMLALLVPLLLYCAWRVYAHWWAWQHFGIKVDGKTGMMEIVQKGPWILNLPYSSDDTVNLGEEDIKTPPRSLLQRKAFFDCDTITYTTTELDPDTGKYTRKVREIQHVDDVHLINEIQKYVRSLPYVETRLSQQARDISHMHYLETKGLRKDMRELFRPKPTATVNMQPAGGNADDIVDAELVDDD